MILYFSADVHSQEIIAAGLAGKINLMGSIPLKTIVSQRFTRGFKYFHMDLHSRSRNLLFLEWHNGYVKSPGSRCIRVDAHPVGMDASRG